MSWPKGRKHTLESIERIRAAKLAEPSEVRRARMDVARAAIRFVRTPVLDRIWSKVTKGDGCWLWTGATRNGYGVIQVGTHDEPRAGYVHRLVWEAETGPIPEGMDISHRCHTRLCVRTAHMEVATRAENMQRSVADGWPNGNRWTRAAA